MRRIDKVAGQALKLDGMGFDVKHFSQRMVGVCNVLLEEAVGMGTITFTMLKLHLGKYMR